MAPTTYLLTGGAGFMGSNLAHHLLTTYPHIHLVVLDALTYAGNRENLKEIETTPALASRFTFVQGNICDAPLVENLFLRHSFQGVFHLAAETHVDNSISGPAVFMHTNLMGTFTLLQAAYTTWFSAPNKPKPAFQNARFHHVSTDEVYGTLGPTGLFTEATPYAPNSPYSASKAGSDFLVRAYHHTYGLNTTLSNCSNNFGPRQHAEKLIPTIIRKALTGHPIPIYGDGQNIRDWLYVHDHSRAVDAIFHQGQAGHTYNIGGRNEQVNTTIAQMLCTILDDLHPAGAPHAKLITFVADRPGHDRRYAIDPAKLETELGWHPAHTFAESLRQTAAWYVAHLANASTQAAA